MRKPGASRPLAPAAQKEHIMERYPLPYFRLLILGLLMLLATAHLSPVFGQAQFSISTYLMRDDNAFRSRNQTNDWISTLAGTGSYTWGGDNWALQSYYKGDYSQFAEYSERANTAHRMGMGLSGLLGESVIGTMGVSWRGRYNTNDYSIYNTQEINFNSNLRWTVSETSILTAGISMLRNNFTEFKEITNNEYLMSAAFQHFFETRTSLKLTTSLGHKVYPNQTRINYLPNAYYQNRLPQQFEETIEASQLSMGVTVGQSLLPKTGLSLSAGTRQYLSDAIEQYVQDDYLFTENDLFDDPYASESNWLGATLTHQFAIGFQMKLGTELQWKNYKGTPAFDEAGSLLPDVRDDLRKEYYFMITKKFSTPWKLPSTIDVFTNVMLRDNASNDKYYDYFDHIGLVGFTLGF
jgi:hypothetical protein